jgi:hypothetical protein
MITANNEAIDAAIGALREQRARLVDDSINAPLGPNTFRAVLGQLIEAAIPHLTDAGQPLTCNVQAGESLKSTCSCGHRVSRHESIDGEIRCNECNAQPRPGTIESRIDGLVDVVLRQEQRLVEAIEPTRATTAPGWLSERLDQIDEALASLKQDDAMQVEAVNRAWHRGRNSGLEQGRSEGVELTELDTGPTDYEVWRDALSLATSDIVGEELQTPKFDSVLNRALWFRDQLKRPIRDAPNSEHQPEPLTFSADEPGTDSEVSAIKNADTPHPRWGWRDHGDPPAIVFSGSADIHEQLIVARQQVRDHGYQLVHWSDADRRWNNWDN